MRIGLLADTHIPEASKRLPHEIREAFRSVDLILHAGDIFNISALDELEELAPVLAARGDDDGYMIIRDRRAKHKQHLSVEGISILLTHIGPVSWHPPGETPDQLTHQIIASQHKPTPDIIVCGHTHKAAVEKENGILVVNPGSPTFPQYKYQLGTVALLTVCSGEAEVRIVQLSKFEKSYQGSIP